MKRRKEERVKYENGEQTALALSITEGENNPN